MKIKFISNNPFLFYIDNKKKELNYDFFELDYNFSDLCFSLCRIYGDSNFTNDFFLSFLNACNMSVPSNKVYYESTKFAPTKKKILNGINYKNYKKADGSFDKAFLDELVKKLKFFIYYDTEKQAYVFDKITEYDCKNNLEIAIACLNEISKKELIFRECGICKKYFIIDHRNEKYCDRRNENTLYPNKSCKCIATILNSKENANIHKKIYDMLFRRLASPTKYTKERQNDFDTYCDESSNWKEKVKTKIEAEESYTKWLLEQLDKYSSKK